MIPIPTGVRVWLVTGHIDMRKGFDGLALIVQETLKRDPHSGHPFVFFGRSGSLVKCLWSERKKGRLKRPILRFYLIRGRRSFPRFRRRHRSAESRADCGAL